MTEERLRNEKNGLVNETKETKMTEEDEERRNYWKNTKKKEKRIGEWDKWNKNDWRKTKKGKKLTDAQNKESNLFLQLTPVSG